MLAAEWNQDSGKGLNSVLFLKQLVDCNPSLWCMEDIAVS